MAQIGKKQKLLREFRLASIAGYVMILGWTSECALINIIISFPTEGKAVTPYAQLQAICGMFFNMLVDGGNGEEYGSKFSWTISLVFRIRAWKMAKLPLLQFWLSDRLGVIEEFSSNVQGAA
ncbi:hypothetical protein M433DRAFT_20939 [Acidomyces richmondensis BFW]|nr:MAG: hypothetical protein FE78DRAFT_39076 [Acidomyces sp. 'richmondensis']KYG50007.1 hypothetical protein M433DRAFT_20939 [Acidomyces richmondensis BFW]